MSNVIPFVPPHEEQYTTEELIAFKEMLEVQLQAARSFSEPILQDLAWINSQLAANECKQMHLPFGSKVFLLWEEEDEE